MERAIPILPADDLAAAKDFYVNKLGFSLDWEWNQNEKQGMFGVSRGGITLTIDCPMTGHGREACVSLEVGSADAYYEEWVAKIPIKRAPINEDWGARTFGVTDPAGNTIFVMGPLKR